MRAQLVADFERFKDELPRDFPAYVRDAYHIDLTARYLGQTLPHPIGKGSGQLSLNERQLDEDRAAGLAFVVLKTLIAEDDAGVQSMAAWAIHETRMKVERRRVSGADRGWTVTWKGRGWDRSFDDYLELVRAGRDLTRSGELLVVPSVKYHLPRLGVPFVESEYRYTTGRLAEAWDEPPLLVEKDFSPTLAGDSLAGVGSRVRGASSVGLPLAILPPCCGRSRSSEPVIGHPLDRPRSAARSDRVETGPGLPQARGSW